MTVRKNITAWAVAAALALGVALPAIAADTKAPAFGQLRTASAEQAKAQAEKWLKDAGKFDAAAFTKVWSKDDLSILEATAESLALGSPEAAKLLDEARTSDAAAPKEVPAFFKDAKDQYLATNVGLVYAKLLASNRVYEEALGTLKLVNPEQAVDPSAYFFYKAVAEHHLLQKESAVKSITRLLDDVSDAPDRYKMLATIMFFDIQGWKKDQKDLANISKLMANSERRLDLGRGGEETQEIQKKIIFRLDELIKEKENQCNGGGQCNGGNCPGGGSGQGKGAGAKPTSPMKDSNLGGSGGKGEVQDIKIREIQENWGKMPERERAKALQDITRDLPPRYRQVIEDYFKALSKANPAP